MNIDAHRSGVGKEFEAVERGYDRRIRPFLMREEPNRVPEYDADLERLRRMKLAPGGELAVCFLGVAGVGKSTLINALVAGREMILPSGGIGPLTAQALTVRRGCRPCFEVEYHPPGQLWKIIFALERRLDPARKRPIPGEALSGDEGTDLVELDPAERVEIDAIVLDDEPASKGKLAEFIKQAQLMVTGTQDGQADLAYLADSLRVASGKPRARGTQTWPADEGRILRLRAALSLTQAGHSYRREGAADDFEFRDDLAEHAAGFLAPLIRKLDVTWDGDLASEEVVLVDLPGVGIANDIYRNVTHEWVRERARTVVLVVGNRGVTEPDAEMLRSSGFLNRLLYSFENPSDDPISLMVSIVRLDDSAETRWAAAKAKGVAGKKKRDYFAELCSEAAQKIRNDLRQELEKVWASAGFGQGQAQVIENLIQRLEIHPLSAVEFRKHLIGDEEDPSFLADPDQSNVPNLRASLLRQARERRATTKGRIGEECALFASKLERALDLIRAQWLEENRASQEAERLREEFLVFLEPLMEEFIRRQGAFRNFLKETLPEVIEKLVARARGEARTEISAYLQGLGMAHFKTLQDAVRRGGIFYGAKQIELPKDFALRFEVPIAEVWGKEILKRVRSETNRYADVCVMLLQDVVGRAHSQGAKFPTRVVEAQREVIKADAKNLESVGRTMVNELREEVSRSLVRGLEGPIRARCLKFVEANLEVGGGAKSRMLGLFGELADHATEEASVVAVEIILECFREVEQQILAVFARHKDPLDAVKEAIISSHEQWKKRSDAQRKRRVLDDLEAILASAPPDLGAEMSSLPEVAA